MKRALLKLTAWALILITGLTAVSCRKETVYIKDRVVVLPPAHTVDGIWMGSYTVDVLPQLGQQYYSLILKPDGTAINETKWTGQTHINSGTWQMKGDTLICNTICIYGYEANIGVKEVHTAIFNKRNGTLTKGEWRNPAPGTGRGDVVLTKKQD
ncbi:hypothetical protein LQ567_13485 [Niabella pedocola]|uniref:Lipocalin-like domain-containing protein n=1 Tax=Niabella pedocola TaxID=1752077 RepID=A0ABS8PU04_9BACT|nr:hypothetical protein [Niabella pedocola]MCD2423782.1 hypothetical protein [Niabella pedocola]